MEFTAGVTAGLFFGLIIGATLGMYICANEFDVSESDTEEEFTQQASGEPETVSPNKTQKSFDGKRRRKKGITGRRKKRRKRGG